MKSFVLVTGASSGIGQSCAELLAEQGANLILVARRYERLEALKNKLETAFGVEIKIFSVDVSDETQVREFFESIKDISVSTVINNAGLSRGRDKFQDSQWTDLSEMIQTNVLGFTLVARKSIPKLIKTKGHLINISSIAGREPYVGGHVYCGTKSFVKSFSKALRKDLLGTQVRVTDIAPGAVETEFSVVRFHGDKSAADKVYDSFDNLIAKDIAEAVLFAIKAPKRVNIEEMVVYPTNQASPVEIYRN
ncbi:NAD(P)-dependent oxidoreductase [bacterium DOLZORAL124_38_8]|nr:MAG: NAD(P)-dependent oxidoreductase [bacterium DOLZORAL124_38_8]